MVLGNFWSCAFMSLVVTKAHTKMDSTKYQELLAKYLKGECTEAEQLLLEQWYESLDSEVELPNQNEKKKLLAHNWEVLASQTVRSAPLRKWYQQPYWAAAAAIIIALGLGWLLFKPAPSAISTFKRQLTSLETPLVEHTNTSSKNEQITLADGSRVTLHPQSRLSYPKDFVGTKREVILEGEAFFEVQKNPQKPFLVYSNHLTTKVLGTSFLVKAYAHDKNTTVAVRTGKVSVYATKSVLSTAESAKDANPEAVVLTPNQQVTYVETENKLVKTLVEKPAILIPLEETPSFAFQKAPLSTIIAAFEKTYGIDIVYDEALMSHCLITTTLEQENLYDNLTIICKLLNASYEVVDTQVVIKGAGCQ